MAQFAVFRLMDYKPGCVDFLGTIEAEDEDEAESLARLMYPIDYALGERLDIEIEEEEYQCKTCEAPLLDFTEIQHGECEGCMVRRLYPNGNPHRQEAGE